MASRAVLSGALLSLLGLAGCGSPSPELPKDDPAAEQRRFDRYRDVTDEEVRAREKLAKILAGVYDRRSMSAARAQIAAHAKVVAELDLRRGLLGRPSPELQQRLQQELGKRLEDSEKAINRQVARIRELPGGAAFFEDLRELNPSKGP